MNQQSLSAVVRVVTVAAAEIAFLGLIASFVIETLQADGGSPPDLGDVQVAAAGALAAVLGAGYAQVLGVPPNNDGSLTTLGAAKRLLQERMWLSLGIILYMLAGIAACLVYGLNEAETPGVLRTIAIGFGGYVIAYVGTAYRQLS